MYRFLSSGNGIRESGASSSWNLFRFRNHQDTDPVDVLSRRTSPSNSFPMYVTGRLRPSAAADLFKCVYLMRSGSTSHTVPVRWPLFLAVALSTKSTCPKNQFWPAIVSLRSVHDRPTITYCPSCNTLQITCSKSALSHWHLVLTRGKEKDDDMCVWNGTAGDV